MKTGSTTKNVARSSFASAAGGFVAPATRTPGTKLDLRRGSAGEAVIARR